MLPRPLARWRHRRVLARMAGPRLLRAYAEARPHATWVEVGANDGVQHDHLRPLLVDGLLGRGVMVEPVPYVFARLEANYAGMERVALERAAVVAEDGTAELWHLREPAAGERHLPDWYDGVSSLDRATVERHAAQVPGLAERLVRARVPALTFASVCAKHGLDRVDLVVIDTEGHDWAILRSIDLDRHRPDLIVFEHFHLDLADRASARAHAEAHGYATMEEGFDTLCLHAEAPAEVRRLWRRLRPAVPGVSKHDER